MRPITITRQILIADLAAIAAFGANPVSTVPLNLNGPLSVDGVADLGDQQIIGIGSLGNVSAILFLVEGLNGAGQAISEIITGVNAGTVPSALEYSIVLRITPNATGAFPVRVGTQGTGGSLPIPIDIYQGPTDIGLGIVVDGVVTYTVEHTFDDIFDGNPSAVRTWFPHPTLVTETTNQEGVYEAPVRAIRILNVGVGRTTMTVVQSGAIG